MLNFPNPMNMVPAVTAPDLEGQNPTSNGQIAAPAAPVVAPAQTIQPAQDPRVRPAVPSLTPSAAEVAAATNQMHQETGNPFQAFAQGWTNAAAINNKAQREQQAIEYEQAQAAERKRRQIEFMRKNGAEELAAMAEAGMVDNLQEEYSKFRENRAKGVKREWQVLPDGTAGWAIPETGEFEPVGNYAKPADDKAPKTLKVTRSDGSEVVTQWNPETKEWDPIKAPEGGAVVNSKTDLTENQAKLTLFKSLQSETTPVLDTLETKFNPSNLKDAFAGGVLGGNFIRSETGQIYYASAAAWAEGALRIATGAAATQPEIERTVRTYFAQPGDSVATIEFKSNMRQMYLRSIDRALGETNVEGTLTLPKDFAAQFIGEDEAADNTPAEPAVDIGPPPEGLTQEEWDNMDAEGRALWQN